MDKLISFAPMEGITNHIYRKAHAAHFQGIDAYYSPFIAPNSSHKLTTRELVDILPENNPGIRLIPQVLTRSPADFLWCAEKLRSLGYDEINLNLGCPSGTVVSKGKGAGQLSDPEALEAFLEEIFKNCPLAISAKTRIGLESRAELPRLLAVFRKFPFQELIVHPRTRVMQYKGTPDEEAFSLALEGSPFPVSWNGDVFCEKDALEVAERFPETHAVMIGRGFITDPGLSCVLKGLPRPEKAVYRSFAQEVFEGYMREWNDKKAVVFHMKEFWSYMIGIFPDAGKYAKRIRKAASPEEYLSSVSELFEERDIVPREEWAFRRL